MQNILNPALALIVAGLTAPVCLAEWSISNSGNWPNAWPTELEPLRSQSRTLWHEGSTMYHIPFTDRAEFEAVWPHLLSILDDEAPLTLWRGHDRWTAVDFDAGVVIFTPNTGQRIVPGVKSATIYVPGVLEGNLPAGTYLTVGPPWPDTIRDALGRLPEHVVADGLKWRADNETRAPRKRGQVRIRTRRSRTDVRLIVDGKVVDLNRIELPNSVIDRRFDEDRNP